MGCGGSFASRKPHTKSADFSSVFSAATRAPLSVPAGRIIVAQGEDVEGVYRVERGFLRQCVYTDDGQRRIVSFCGSGTIVGLGQKAGSQWTVSVEAVTTCVITSAPRAFVDRCIAALPGVRKGALEALQAEIERRERHLVMMGVLPATSRVHTFLKAYAQTRGSSDFISLPMCRRDIGDYLGLSMETVSRSFTALRESGDIELRGSEKFRLAERRLVCGARRAA